MSAFGGFNPIKDLYKTEVYRLARLRNGWRPYGALGPVGPVIPENVLVRAPGAELRENQTDQDSLPPYDQLDAVLERLVEREEPIAAIVDAGFDRDMVMRIERMLYVAEYKRRQAAPGVKVTLKNFGRDRRYPIVNRFRDPGTALPPPRPRRCGARQRARRWISSRNGRASPAGVAEIRSACKACLPRRTVDPLRNEPGDESTIRAVAKDSIVSRSYLLNHTPELIKCRVYDLCCLYVYELLVQKRVQIAHLLCIYRRISGLLPEKFLEIELWKQSGALCCRFSSFWRPCRDTTQRVH